MVLLKSTHTIRLWLWLFLVTLAMFSCVPPCPSVFSTKQGLHRHETVCLTFSTVRALKIERRREALSRPSKRAKTKHVRFVLSFTCRESLTDPSHRWPNRQVQWECSPLQNLFFFHNLLPQPRLGFRPPVDSCARSGNLVGIKMNRRLSPPLFFLHLPPL